MSSTPPPPPPPRLASSECVGYDERWHRWIERFIEVYHAAHSATVPALLLPIEVFASGRSSTLWCITWWWIWCWCSIIWCGPVSNGAGAQRGAFLEQHFAPSVPLPSSPGHLIMFHATRRFSFLRFPFCQFEVYLNTPFLLLLHLFLLLLLPPSSSSSSSSSRLNSLREIFLRFPPDQSTPSAGPDFSDPCRLTCASNCPLEASWSWKKHSCPRCSTESLRKRVQKCVQEVL